MRTDPRPTHRNKDATTTHDITWVCIKLIVNGAQIAIGPERHLQRHRLALSHNTKLHSRTNAMAGNEIALANSLVGTVRGKRNRAILADLNSINAQENVINLKRSLGISLGIVAAIVHGYIQVNERRRRPHTSDTNSATIALVLEAEPLAKSLAFERLRVSTQASNARHHARANDANNALLGIVPALCLVARAIYLHLFAAVGLRFHRFFV